MGAQTRRLMRRSATLVVIVASVSLLSGCGSEGNDGAKNSAKKKNLQLQNESVRPDGARTDPNRQRVEPARPLPPKQLFLTLDLNKDGVIDEDEMRAAYHCEPGRFCSCDKKLVETLFENRAEFGHRLSSETSAQPVDGKLSAGGSDVSFPTTAGYTTVRYGVNLTEFERFLKDRTS